MVTGYCRTPLRSKISVCARIRVGERFVYQYARRLATVAKNMIGGTTLIKNYCSSGKVSSVKNARPSYTKCKISEGVSNTKLKISKPTLVLKTNTPINKELQQQSHNNGVPVD